MTTLRFNYNGEQMSEGYLATTLTPEEAEIIEKTRPELMKLFAFFEKEEWFLGKKFDRSIGSLT